jgi:hypothetical protein
MIGKTMAFLCEGAPDDMLFGAPSLVGGLLWLPLGQWLATIAYLYLAFLLVSK